MATFDGARPKSQKEEDGDSDGTEFYDPKEVCARFPDTVETAEQKIASPRKMIEVTVTEDSPEYMRYRDMVAMRADYILSQNQSMSHNEAMKLAQMEIASVANNPEQISNKVLVDRLGDQQEVMLRMLDRLSSVEDRIKGQGAVSDSISGVAVKPALVDSPPISGATMRPIGQSTEYRSSVPRSQSVVTNSRLNLSNTKQSKYYSKPISFVEEGVRTSFSKKQLSIEKFSGEDKDSWEAFLNQFLMISHHNEWTEKEACCHLQKLLTGKAKDFIFESPSAKIYTEFVELVDVLSQRFGSTDNYVQDAKQLRTRRKMKGETFQDMIQDISQIVGRLYGDNEIVVTREAHQAFLRGLSDNFRVAAASADPSNSADWVRACISMCAAMDLDEKEVGVAKGRVAAIESDNSNNQTQKNDSNQSNSNNRRWNNNQKKTNGPKRNMENVLCYRCNKRGHMARNCTNEPKAPYCTNCKTAGHKNVDCPKLAEADSGNEKQAQ
jgi:hypothetical protein